MMLRLENRFHSSEYFVDTENEITSDKIDEIHDALCWQLKSPKLRGTNQRCRCRCNILGATVAPQWERERIAYFDFLDRAEAVANGGRDPNYRDMPR